MTLKYYLKLSYTLLSSLRHKFLLASILGLVSTPHAFADISLTTPSGVSLQIADQQSGTISLSALIQDWPLLCVQAACADGQCEPCLNSQIYHAQDQSSSIELSGRQRATNISTLEGIEVQRRIYVPLDGPNEANAFVRVLDQFYNPSTQVKSISVSLGSLSPTSLIGSANSQVWRTSSYDADFNLEDRWVLIDDDQANAGQDNLVILYQGAGGQSPDVLNHDQQARTLSWRFNEITIPARQSVNLITIIQVESSRVQALAEARNLVRYRPVDVVFGLDNLERRAIHNVDIDPDNACPIADLNGPYNGNEGQAIQVSAASSFDLEEADLIYRWDLDQDGVFGEAGLESEGANLLITYAQNGDYPIAVEVEDPLGKIDRDHVVINVRNVAPTMDQLLSNSPIGEGERAEVVLNGSDIGVEDVLSYAIDWEGNGTFEAVNATSSHLYPQDGTYNAQARVSDDDGGSTTVPFEVVVNNLPPVIQQVIANNPSREGAEVRFVVQASDPGQDQLTYRFDFDNDGTYEVTNTLGEASTVFAEDGSYIIKIEVSDNRGASTQFNYPLSVQNVSPTIENLTMIGEASEGSSVQFMVTASDEGRFDLLTYDFDLDGQEGYDVSQSAASLNYQFPDSGLYTVKVRVSDDEGAFATRTMVVNVANLPPSATLQFEGEQVQNGLVATANQGARFDVVAQGSDPSAVDANSLTYSWDLNQDGVYEILASDARQSLLFDQEGSYIIRCLVRDKDLGESIVESEILIAGQPPQLNGITIENDVPYLEGTPLRFQVEASDSDPLTYEFDFNGDRIFDLESTSAQASWAFPNEGSYEVLVRVSDQSGFVEDTITVEVLNAPPTLELNTGMNVGEGEDLSVFVTPRDPGEFDDIIVTVTLQNQTETVTLSPNQVTLFTIPTQDNGFIDITAQAVDDAGAQSIEYTARAFIENRPPFIPPFSPAPAREGEQYLQVIPADDPAGLNDLIFYSLIEPPANVSIDSSGLLLWTPSYEDYLNSPITFELLIEDEDGGRLERSISIEVIARDIDNDGIPDSYELETCERLSPCLNPADPSDAEADPDQDGVSSYEEWEQGSDPFSFEGPTIPLQLSPGEAEVVTQFPLELIISHVESTRLLPPNPDGSLNAREIKLEYELYADVNLESLIETSGMIDMTSISNEEDNRWTPNLDNLIEDQLYWWRVRAADGPAISSWSELRTFRVNTENQAPEAPVLILPMDGSVVADLTPNLSFHPSQDPDRESVYYVIRGYRESPDGLVVDFGGQVEANGEEPVSFTPNNRLQENARYQWDVVAVDEVGLESIPSERWSFIVDLENDPPSEPEIISPSNGDTINELRPLFQASGSIDREGTAVSYHFQVREVGGTAILAQTPSEGVFAENGVAQWVANEDLNEDIEHSVSLFASDGQVQTGIVTARFFVSAEDNPPNKPELLAPNDNALLAAKDAILIWSESRDPERGNVRYQVEYCSPQGNCQESEILDNNSYSLENLIPELEVYRWRVQSFDDANNTLGYGASRSLSLISSSNENDDGSGGCQQKTTQNKSTFGLIWLIFSLALLRLRLREDDL